MSDMQKEIDNKFEFTLTEKCAVCSHDLENPVFCKECGASHCAACWFLTGMCATYQCGNSEVYRPSIQEQEYTAQDKHNKHIFNTLEIMRTKIDLLERNLDETKFRRKMLIVGSLFIIISCIVALAFSLPYALEKDPVLEPPVVKKKEKESFIVGRSYIIDKDYIMWNSPVEDPYNHSKWGQKLLRSGNSIQILERHRVDWNKTWFKIQAKGFYGNGWIVVFYE